MDLLDGSENNEGQKRRPRATTVVEVYCTFSRGIRTIIPFHTSTPGTIALMVSLWITNEGKPELTPAVSLVSTQPTKTHQGSVPNRLS